jgi:hypothetical protein
MIKPGNIDLEELIIAWRGLPSTPREDPAFENAWVPVPLREWYAVSARWAQPLMSFMRIRWNGRRRVNPFRQVALSDEQLQAGLMESVDGLPIPSEPVAMTSVRAADLGVLAGITFQETFDDLDAGYFAILEFAGSFGVMLTDYSGSPLQGTRICTDPMGQRSRSRLEIILDALHLSRDQLIWTVEGLE